MSAMDWLKDSSNQNLLKFLGGAVVAIAVAGWTAYSTVFPKEVAKAVVPVVSAVPPVSSVPLVSSVPPNNPQQINAASGSAAIGNVTGGSVTINVGK